MAEKRCSKCKRWKALDRFCSSRNRKDGKSCWCKQCQAEYKQNQKPQIQAYRQKESVKIANREAQKRYRNSPYGKAMKKLYHKKKTAQEFLKWLTFWHKQYGVYPIDPIFGNVLDFMAADTHEVTFDHRRGPGKQIKINPGSWARGHSCNNKNKQIWLEEDFGVVSHRTNNLFRTDINKRKELVIRIVEYVFGKDKAILLQE